VKNNIQHQPPEELINWARTELEREGFAIDYIEIVSADTLEKATTLNQPLIALIAATTGGVRLIDNMILN
jgi:pantothenate synthetase